MDQSLNKFRYQELEIEILKTIKGFTLANEPKISVILRIINKSKIDKFIVLEGSRYISKESGILEMYFCVPGFSQKYKINSESFVDFDMQFKMKDSLNGDRFEIKLNDAIIVVFKNDGDWSVADYHEIHNINDNHTNPSKANYIIRIEHLDTLEEKIGIILQNFSLKKEGEDCIETYCEILSSGDIKESSFWITAVAYDKNNKIAGYDRELIEKENFLGFKVLRNQIYLDKPLSSIERILIYPEL